MEMRVFLLGLLVRAAAATTNVGDCSCGFLDPRTGAVWTEAIVTYANETDRPPTDTFLVEDYQHLSEKNWNARYRGGAAPANLGFDDATSPGWSGNAWKFALDPPTKDHFVMGASLRTLRRDIRYGTFESALGPPKPGVGGSVLAMRVDYNESQTLNINVMNADDPNDAWTSFMMYGDWRGTRSKGVNFTDYGNSSYKYGSSPWGLVPYRFDWSDKEASFFLGDALVRSVSRRNVPKGWPNTPSTLYFRHSSIGDRYTSEGPPPNGSYAHVGMVRAFFNSSLMTVADHVAFDARCGGARAGADASGRQCLVTDVSLRGASPFAHAATVAFSESPPNYRKRWPAIFIASICIAVSTVLLVHALLKRAPWNKTTAAPVPEPAAAGSGAASTTTAVNSRRTSKDVDAPVSAAPSVIYSEGYGLTLAAQTPGFGTPGAVTPGTLTPGGGYFARSIASNSPAVTPGFGDSEPVTRPNSSSHPVPYLPLNLSIHRKNASDGTTTVDPSNKSLAASTTTSSADTRTSLDIATIAAIKHAGAFTEQFDEKKKQPQVQVKEIQIPAPAAAGAKPPVTPPKARVDYLAGLVS